MQTEQQSPSSEERNMLRDSVRGFVGQNWAKDADEAAQRKFWQGLCEQGLAELGRDADVGGLSEVSVVLQELGKANCPLPMIAAAVINLGLWKYASKDSKAAALLDKAAEGEAVLAFSLGDQDAEKAAGKLTQDGGKLSGKLQFVEAAALTSHLLVVLPKGREVAIVDLSAAGVTIQATRAMGTQGLYTVELANAAVESFAIEEGTVADLIHISRLCHAARAIGAVTEAFELAKEWAKERKQFGHAIGSYQAIQHKLVNSFTAIEAATLSLNYACSQYDSQDANWRIFSSSAFAYAAATLRQVSLENHHSMGAIGYAMEHPMPGLTERLHLDLNMHGGFRKARAELAEFYLSKDGGSMLEYDLGESGNKFRAEVRKWLQDNWIGERKDAYDSRLFSKREHDAEFARKLGETGWLALSWPKEFGGQARTPFEEVAYLEEMENAEAPRAGAEIQAAMLRVHGTREQQEKYLGEIRRGEAIHGMGYSEPNSGSDLASLMTKAEWSEEDNEWVINGQKIWTTTYWGDYILLATRTDFEVKPRHAGITLFMVPTSTKGITIRPMTTMYDGRFSNVFYDDVRLPDSSRIGEVNGGWKVLTGALASERGFVGAIIVSRVLHYFNIVCDYIRNAEVDGKRLADDPYIRDRIADFAAQIEAGRLMSINCVGLVENSEMPPHYAAMNKIFSSELMERFGETALDMIGMTATLSQEAPGAILRGRIEQYLRHSLMWVISMGTNEIQRNLIAIRGLELPRS
ncbi:MAG: acyl-CoA dehydrogenase [Alphaproteobacteria bacterium]|nr:MAG: acyl-CoA dehydrogenase [Alphaproteobacteria bacterium]